MQQVAGAVSRTLISAQVQVVLVIAGLVCVIIAILGSGDFVKVVIPPLKRWARISLAATGLVVFVLAFIPELVSNPSSVPKATPNTSDRSASATGHDTVAPTPTSTGPVVTLTAPTYDQQVSRSQGFVASGRASSLGSSSVWILDYDGGYTVDQQATVASGFWSAVDQPLGDSSDHLPYYLTMRVVLAHPKCASILQKTNEGNNDYLNQLPAGCTYLTGVTVHVTKP